MTQEEKIAHLRAENQALREALSQALARIEELEKQKMPPPEFVKANVKKPQAEEKKPRKKRDAKHNQARRRSIPTQIVEHHLAVCPKCDLRLGGISVARSREVIDLPPAAAVQITEHRIFKGWCAGCQNWHEAPVDLHEEVLGQGRIGVRLASLIATLRTVMRLPVRQIRALLSILHGVQVSIGEIVEVLHRLVTHAQPVLDDLKSTIRGSPAVQADETGWREDGLNGYIWSVCTPTIRYYEYRHSRGGDVVKHLIGEEFQGVLGSDFYAGYNIHAGLHQRCWVHFLRDVHDLKKQFPQDEVLLTWATQVKAAYDEAVAWAAQGPDSHLTPRVQHRTRVAQQHAFEQRLGELCKPFLREEVPQQTLCKRVESFLPELFVFVAVPGVPAHNNLAERDLRMAKVQQKISGTFRSATGATVFCRIRSYLSTMQKQGHTMLPSLVAVFNGHPFPVAWAPK